MTAAHPSATEIAADARWLLQAIDPAAGLARLVAMTPDSYRAASFLDDRMLVPGLDARLVPLELVIQGAAQAAERSPGWIFHIGHVGSTLLARLLGELPGVLSVREPRALRDLALTPADQRGRFVAPVRALYARSFGEADQALVKATSFVSELAAELVASEGQALFLSVSPQSYIQTILAGPNSRQELRALLAFRLERMKVRVPAATASPADHDATLAALAWACEMTSLESAAERLLPGQVRWADFDGFLAAPEREFTAIAAFFEYPAAADQVAALLAGPLMRRYSKALEYEYSPALRRELLEEAAAEHRQAIAAALSWLERAADSSPLLRRALDRATT